MPTCQHVKTCHKHAKGSCQCLFKQNNSTFKAKGTRAHVPAVYWSPWADVLPKFSIGNRSTLLQPVIAIASRDPAFALIETLESLLLARVSLTASGFALCPGPSCWLLRHPRLSTSSASAPSFGSLITRPPSLHESSRPGLLPPNCHWHLPEFPHFCKD